MQKYFKINRKISKDAILQIFIGNSAVFYTIILCTAFFLNNLFFILLFVPMLVYNYGYYRLIKTGVFIRCNPFFVTARNDTKHKDRVNMRYIYEVDYYDIYDTLHKRRFGMRREIPDEKLMGMQLIFSIEKPKKAVVFSNEFFSTKRKSKSLWREKYLTIENNGTEDTVVCPNSLIKIHNYLKVVIFIVWVIIKIVAFLFMK